MKNYHALRTLPTPAKPFRKGDVLVLFGELFNRGYANGLVEEAERLGMKIIKGTVGRRTPENELRPLTSEELSPGTINIPLEAGFDLEKLAGGASLVDLLKDVKLTDWENFALDPQLLKEGRQKGNDRFRKNVRQFVGEVERTLQDSQNVVFAHLMAGGVPRTRIIMPLMNRVFKGTGDRHLSSETFWKSGLGKAVAESFLSVTSDTFQILIEETEGLRTRRQQAGAQVSYSAYGYHGTEVWHGDKYQWQSYAPYLQGWAKMALEDIARTAHGKGLKAAVYNCPEILTNSSSIFQGVEVPLYPLVKAFDREHGKESAKSRELRSQCAALLKPEITLEALLDVCEKTLTHPAVKAQSNFDRWPDHNSKEQMEVLLKASDAIFDMHKDPKALMTAVLSEKVFKACGRLMLADLPGPQAPVSWINHDVVASVN